MKVDDFKIKVCEEQLLTKVKKGYKKDLNKLLKENWYLISKPVLDEFYDICYEKGYKFSNIRTYIPSKYKILIDARELMKYTDNRKLIFMFRATNLLRYNIFERNFNLSPYKLHALLIIAKSQNKDIVVKQLEKEKEKIVKNGSQFAQLDDFTEEEWKDIENLYSYKDVFIKSYNHNHGFVNIKGNKIHFSYDENIVFSSGKIKIINTRAYQSKTTGEYIKLYTGKTQREWNNEILLDPYVIDMEMLEEYKRYKRLPM